MPSNTTLITDDPLQAAQWVKQGKLLAYPTESVWGIGCDPFNEAAVAQILEIKHRPIEKGMIVVTDSIERIQPLLLELPETSRQQVMQSWQYDCDKPSMRQAHTWLLPLPAASNIDLSTESTPAIPSWITGDHDSVAVRVISYPLIGELCKSMVSAANPYGFIVSTSCNLSQKNPATTFTQAYDYFADNICYLQGETLGFTLPSLIRDAVSGAAIR